MRDAEGRTGWKLMKGLLRQWNSPNRRSAGDVLEDHGRARPCCSRAAIAAGHWWLYPVLWLAPYLTVWRVINRLRSIAEHGGMERSKDRRRTTHSVRQHAVARFMLVPYNIGWHLAHHVDSGVPFRNLPEAPRRAARGRLRRRDDRVPPYPAIWKALRRPDVQQDGVSTTAVVQIHSRA